MAIKIRIPTPLRQLTNGVDIAEASGATVGDVLNDLTAKFAGMDKRLFKTPGELNRFVSIYVNDEDIRFLENLQTPVKEGDDVSIVPAIAGG
jgi:molybdopterin synthase sulfur carrier subunit